MKKILAVILALTMMLALIAGCGAKEEPAEAPVVESEEVEASVQETKPEAPVEEAPEAEPAPEEVEEVKVISYPLDTDVTLGMVCNLESHMQRAIENFDQVLAMQVYMEKTGVDIEFQMLGDTVFTEQLNLLITSGDIPDMIQGSMAGYASKLETAIEDEVLIDITPYLPDYAPDYWALLDSDETFYEAVMNSNYTTSVFNGYGLPILDTGLIVRGDWMDALGLEDPKTLSELTDILYAMHDAYGTTTTLLTNSALSTGLEAIFNTTANGFDALGFQLTMPGSTTVVAGLASEGYRDYLKYIHDLYADGLINDDFLNISKQLNTYNSCYWNGDCGVWSEGNRCVDPAEFTNSSDPNYLPRAIVRPTLDDGTGTHVVGPGSTRGRGSIYITATCENPDIACSFLNYAYTQEGLELCTYGIEGETFARIDEEHVEYTDLIINNPDGLTSAAAECLYLVSNWFPSVQNKAMFNLKNSVTEVREAAELWTENCGDDSMTLHDAFSLTQEESDRVNALAADVLTLYNEKAILYVMGEISIEDYAAAEEEAMRMGLAECTEIYQNAYDKFLAERG